MRGAHGNLWHLVDAYNVKKAINPTHLFRFPVRINRWVNPTHLTRLLDYSLPVGR